MARFRRCSCLPFRVYQREKFSFSERKLENVVVRHIVGREEKMCKKNTSWSCYIITSGNHGCVVTPPHGTPAPLSSPNSPLRSDAPRHVFPPLRSVPPPLPVPSSHMLVSGVVGARPPDLTPLLPHAPMFLVLGRFVYLENRFVDLQWETMDHRRRTLVGEEMGDARRLGVARRWSDLGGSR